MTRSRRFSRAGLGLALAAAIAAPGRASTAGADRSGSSGRAVCRRRNQARFARADAQVESMRRGGELELAQIAADSLIAGRTHERLLQRYHGLPVFGGALMRGRLEGGLRPHDLRTRLSGHHCVDPSRRSMPRPRLGSRGRRRRAAPKRFGSEAVLGVLPASRDETVLVWQLAGAVGRGRARRLRQRRHGRDRAESVSPSRSAAEHRGRHRRRRRRQESVGDGQLPRLRCDRSLAARHAGHIRLRGIAEAA